MKFTKNSLFNSIYYSQDVLNILKDYCDIMDGFFENYDNRYAHSFCYKTYSELSERLKEKAIERGIIDKKCVGKNL